VLQIPIDRSRVRSLNMATAVGVVLFEAIHQLIVRNGEFFGWLPSSAENTSRASGAD
jgi:tRNA C32,U32 (ribose-2'-O)-methylase TrmJ